jgi:LacI family transcriptional regulator
MSLTISDIAKASGVSQATAARALGNYASVSEKSRRQVLAAARSLGYHRNELAAALVAGSTRTVGLVVGDIENPFFASVVRGLTDVVEVEGHTVLLANSDEDVDRESHAIDTLRSRQVDGLVVATAATTELGHLERAAAAGRPVILIDRPMPDSMFDTVTVGNEEGAAGAVAHLIGHGHSRIGIVTEEPVIASSAERLCGYRRAHSEAGTDVDEALIVEGGPGQEDGRLGALALLGLEHPPTALFTASNLATYGALSAIRELGLRIPDDIALLGFDDFPLAGVIDPPITVVSQPVDEIGRRAGQLLLERLAGDDSPPQRVELETNLVIRRSCGAEEAADD